MLENKAGEQQNIEQEFKFCPNCGNKLSKDSVFCSKCGYSFKTKMNISAESPSLSKKKTKGLTKFMTFLQVIATLLLFGGILLTVFSYIYIAWIAIKYIVLLIVLSATGFLILMSAKYRSMWPAKTNSLDPNTFLIPGFTIYGTGIILALSALLYFIFTKDEAVNKKGKIIYTSIILSILVSMAIAHKFILDGFSVPMEYN